MADIQNRHLSSDESLRVDGPADVKVKRGAGSTLGETEKEGLSRTANDLQEKVQDAWESAQAKSGKVLHQVQEKGADLINSAKQQSAVIQEKVSELKNKAAKSANETAEEIEDTDWKEVTNRKAKKLKGSASQAASEAEGKLQEGKQKLAQGSAKVKAQLNEAVKNRNFTTQDILSYLVPIIILALALVAGTAAYRAYTAPPALPPWNTVDGVKARAGLYSDQASDYLHDQFDYASERAAVLSEQLKSKAGIYTDSAKEKLWKAKDAAAEQANIAYQDALKKAQEAKKVADQKSRDAIHELRSYAKQNTQPEGIVEKIGHKFSSIKDNLANKAGLVGENAKHQANLASENARHKAAETKLKTASSGFADKLKESAHDLKETMKAKIHDKI